MSFFKFIILLAIIGWIIIPVIKKITGAGKKGASRKGITGKLSDFISDIQQEIEQTTARQTDASDTDAGKPAAEDSGLWDIFREPGQSPEKKSASRDAATAAVPEEPAMTLDTPSPEPLPPPEPEQPQIPYDSESYYKTNVSDQLSYNRKQLRKAVVWSEILAPPVSMRDNHKK